MRTCTRPALSGACMCAGTKNVLKRVLVHAGAFNLGLWMRALFGVGTPRSAQGRSARFGSSLNLLWTP
jgi:hypothetical protein